MSERRTYAKLPAATFFKLPIKTALASKSSRYLYPSMMAQNSNKDEVWRVPWLGGTLVLGLLLLGVWWLHSGLSSESQDTVSFVFGLWGVVVTVIGLAIAIWQLSRTTTATIAAAEAVQKLRKDVGTLDVISEIGACKQQIGSALDRVNSSEWKNACTHLSPVRSALNRIIALPNRHDHIDIELFKNHISFLLATETELERLENSEFDSTDMRMNLRQIADSLGQLETVLRDRFGE